MIADHDNTTLISSMGWVDHADLWVFDVAGDRERRVSLNSAARYLEVHGGTGGYFSVAHHFDGPRFDVTVHAFAEPSHPVARASVTEEAWKIDGELAAWRNVPLLYVPFIALPGLKDFMLLTIDPDRGKVEAEKLDWYDDAYDKGYQGVVAVDRIP